MDQDVQQAAQAQSDEGAAPPKTCKVHAALVPRLNLADFQNAVPALTELSIVNDTDQPLQQLDLVVSSEPPFLKSRHWRLEAVGAGQTFHLTERDVQLDGALLSRLTEAEKATVRFALQAQGAAEPLAVHEAVVELLPRNQWGGLRQLPEMVAAFVQPNDSAVDRLLKGAAEVLRQTGKSGAIDGYSKGAARAWELASALWSALAARGLDYALPPASFEQHGQKVRGPSQVLESGLATCLDSALLFAAALEQAHLHPVLVFIKGHAFTGVWLKAEEFATPVIDDVTALRKRLRLKELICFETTLVAQHPAPGFSQACEQADKLLAEEHDGEFELAVDVRRARRARIKPLALAESLAPAAAVDEPSEPAAPVFEPAPDLPEEVIDVPAVALDPKDRLARWQRKLLDLSLRNTLLNFKAGKKALALEAPDAGALEDLLSGGQPLKLLPQPELMDGSDPRSQQIHEARERENLRRAHALDALGRREAFIRQVARVARGGGLRVVHLDQPGIAGSRDDLGHRGRLRPAQPEALAQRLVGHQPVADVLQAAVLVAGAYAVVLAHFGELLVREQHGAPCAARPPGNPALVPGLKHLGASYSPLPAGRFMPARGEVRPALAARTPAPVPRPAQVTKGWIQSRTRPPE